MRIIKFIFEDTDDGSRNDVEILVDVKSAGGATNAELIDAVSSYCETVEDWAYEDIVDDVLQSFDMKYEIITPEVVYI